MFTSLRKHLLPPVIAALVYSALSLPAQAVIFEEFLFNDPAGTAIEAAANNANPGNLFDIDTDNLGVVTNGLGQLETSTKNNNSFGTNYVDTMGFTTGTLYGVMELTWDFQSTLDTAENEEIRITLESADPRSTALTAEFRIVRNDADEITIEGRSGPGGVNINPVTLNGGSLTQSDKFIAVVSANLDTEVYEVLYSSDAGASFLSAGTGTIAQDRGVESLRMALNNDLVNDNILIDRVYLTDVSPVTSIDALTLEVNIVTGNIAIKNDTLTDFDINSYRIASPDNDLNFAGWSSLSDNAIDAIDADIDVDSIVGNGIGETWDEAAGSDNGVLAESFLLGSSVFAAGRSESLGSAFQTGGAETLEFQYRDAVSGAISDGNVVYVTTGLAADVDTDGDVDGADFLIIQRTNPALISQWQTEYSANTNSLAAAQAVPEPTTTLLFVVGVTLLLVSHRHESARRALVPVRCHERK